MCHFYLKTYTQNLPVFDWASLENLSLIDRKGTISWESCPSMDGSGKATVGFVERSMLGLGTDSLKFSELIRSVGSDGGPSESSSSLRRLSPSLWCPFLSEVRWSGALGTVIVASANSRFFLSNSSWKLVKNWSFCCFCCLAACSSSWRWCRSWRSLTFWSYSDWNLNDIFRNWF